MFDPLLIVHGRFVEGADDLSDEVPEFAPIPLSEALATSWPYDAHLSLYTLEGVPAWPRINKALHGALIASETPLTIGLTACDYDTPGHRPLTDPDKAALLAAWERGAPKPNFYYWTTHGARLLFLHQPLPPLEAEALHRGLVQLYEPFLPLDPGVWQWNRCHRLPLVVRDGKPTETPAIRLSSDPLDLSSVPRPVAPLAQVPVSTLKAPLPELQDAQRLVWDPPGRLTDWGRKAKTYLKGRMEQALDALFETHPPPIPRPRNSVLMSWIGCMTTQTQFIPDTSPEHLFGLLIPSVQQSMLNDGRDLLAETWKMICYCWAKQHQSEASDLIGRRIAKETLAGRIQDAWPTPPDPTPEWLQRHLIVTAGRDNYVLQASGLYSPIPVERQSLYAAVRDSGLAGPQGLVQLQRPTPNGPQDLPETALANHYRTIVQPAIRRQPGPRGGWLDQDTLVIGTYRRREDLEPCFHPDVDQWLRHLFGDRYADGCRWIGLALAFERGPICALSIKGDPGVGKKMIPIGLSECVEPYSLPAGGEVFGRWQYGMLETPFIVINESWPPGVRNPDGPFRALVSGDVFSADTKWGHPQRMQINPRVILTANNRDVVARLFSRQGMSHADQQAISQRLFHVECGPEASQFFNRRGNLALTRGWIKEDLDHGTSSSRFVVARHFLWLYQQHGQEGGAGRFLMQDKTDPGLIWNLTASSGLSPIIGRTLVRMLEANRFDEDKDGRVRVTASDLLEFYVLNEQDTSGVRFNVRSIGKSMLPYVHLDVPKSYRTDDGEHKKARALDLAKVLRFAEMTGQDCPKLKRMVSA